MAQGPEVWLRGRVDGYEALLMPVAHSLLQVREELELLAGDVADDVVWLRPGGAASVGFHVRHLGGSLDRLMTYARGESLSTEQLAFLRGEEEPGSAAPGLRSLVDEVNRTIEMALAQVRSTPAHTLLDPRMVGRAGLPSTVLGLLFHAAEHSNRHSGQATSTARLVAHVARLQARK